MKQILRLLALSAAILPVAFPAAASAQSFASTGTRAAGMGGAFVGVADDASAIYWNPAGLAAGSYFTLVLDGGMGEAAPDLSPRGGEGSSLFLGLSMPALGVGYYRLKSSLVTPQSLLLPVDAELSSRNLNAVAELRLDSLVTHHGGITLVQSLVQGVAVGTTLKLVRGIASSTFVPQTTADDVLDADSVEMLGRGTNKFDLDIGVMASGGPLKVGLTIRNVLEPGFEVAGGGAELTLERQARAGLSYVVAQNWTAAADFDLLKTADAFGERRDMAFGVEGRLGARASVRSGFSFNTLDDDGLPGTPRRAFSAGGSFAVKAAVYVDGHFTTGNDRAGRQWGVAARFVY